MTAGSRRPDLASALARGTDWHTVDLFQPSPPCHRSPGGGTHPCEPTPPTAPTVHRTLEPPAPAPVTSTPLRES